MDANQLSRDETNALYDIAIDMRLPFDGVAAPMFEAEPAILRRFEPLTDDASSRRLEVEYCLSMELTEYGVFVRQGNGRLLVWKEFPRDVDTLAELHIVRRALFQAAHRVIGERAQQAEIVANS